MEHNKDSLELSKLIVELIEGSIDEERFRILDDYLCRSPEALSFYREVMKNIVALKKRSYIKWNNDLSLESSFWKELAEYEKSAPVIELPEQKPQRELIQKVVYPPQEKYKMSKFSIFTLITSAAAILVLMAFLVFTAPQSKPVATITGSYNASWGHSEIIQGSRLWDDGSLYRLVNGIVEVTFDSGATVLVESPAELEIIDENEMYIRGVMTAAVPDSAHGFTVNTVNSRVVDLGTEFGLLSSETKGTEVHVRKGTVEHIPAAGTTNLSRLLLKTGQASHMDKAGGLSRMEYRNEQFRWDRPCSYEAVVIGTKPVAYYRFEKGASALGFDEMSRAVTLSENSSLVDFMSGPNIDPELKNQSLRLAGQAESGVFIADKVMELTKGEALSISMWVRPEQSEETGQNVLIYTNNSKDFPSYSNQIYMTDDNRVRFYIHSVTRQREVIETQVPVSLNQWFHIAACYDNKQIKLYINGQLQASRSVAEDFSPEYHENGFWAVGVGSAIQELLPFEGSIDELSFHDRQLSDKEVEILYEAAKH